MGGRGVAQDQEAYGFPLLVTIACLGITILLYLTATAPALRQSQQLHDVEQAQNKLRGILAKKAHDIALTESSLKWDPQTVLVEIDNLGLTPWEILADEKPAPDGR